MIYLRKRSIFSAYIYLETIIISTQNKKKHTTIRYTKKHRGTEQIQQGMYTFYRLIFSLFHVVKGSDQSLFQYGVIEVDRPAIFFEPEGQIEIFSVELSIPFQFHESYFSDNTAFKNCNNLKSQYRKGALLKYMKDSSDIYERQFRKTISRRN